MSAYSFAWLLVALMLPSGSLAKCNLHSALLTGINRLGSTSGAHFTYADWYAKAGCFDLARHELDLSDATIPSDDVDEETKQTKRRATRDMRIFVDALDKASVGRSNAAKSLLLSLMSDESSHRTYSSMVLMSSLDALSELLRKNGTEAEWQRFGLIVNSVPENAMGYWPIEFGKRLAEAHTGKLDQALASVESELAEGVDVQRYVSLRILLGELLVLDHEFDSARIYCANMDADVSALAADYRLKLRYLAMCESAWSEGPKSSYAKRAARSARRIIHRLRGQL